MNCRRGDVAALLTLGIEGVVLDAGAGEVSAGGIYPDVPRSDVALVRRGRAAIRTSPAFPCRRVLPRWTQDRSARQTGGGSADLSGAAHRRAAMASLPWVRIVHGKGTGRLRQEVRRHVANHPLVSSYEEALRRRWRRRDDHPSGHCQVGSGSNRLLYRGRDSVRVLAPINGIWRYFLALSLLASDEEAVDALGVSLSLLAGV